MELGGKDYELGFGHAVKISKYFQLISKCLMWQVLVDIQDCGGYFFLSSQASPPSSGSRSYFSAYWIRTQGIEIIKMSHAHPSKQVQKCTVIQADPVSVLPC